MPTGKLASKAHVQEQNLKRQPQSRKLTSSRNENSFRLLIFPGEGGAPTGFLRRRFLTKFSFFLLLFLIFLKGVLLIFFAPEGGVPPPVWGEVGGFLFFGFPAGDYPRSVLVEGGFLFHV